MSSGTDVRNSLQKFKGGRPMTTGTPPNQIPKNDISTKVGLIKNRFLNRTDKIAIVAPWGKPCPIDVKPEDLDQLIHSHIDNKSSREVVVEHAGKQFKGPFRIGAYTPDAKGFGRWLCFDLDGGDRHSSSLKDPWSAAKEIRNTCTEFGLRSYLERSGGGDGYHVWVFFEKPVEASQLRALGRRILSNLQFPLSNGGFADPNKGAGIEIFPKADKIAETGVGNCIYLPWSSHTPHGTCEFYEPDSAGAPRIVTVSEIVVNSSEKVSSLFSSSPPIERHQQELPNRSSDAFKKWRQEVLARLDLPGIYSNWLTGRKNGAWLECRDPNSPTGDRTPSAGVSLGTPDSERGVFHSFRSGETKSVFDFLCSVGRAADFGEACHLVGELTGIPCPSRENIVESSRFEEKQKVQWDDDGGHNWEAPTLFDDYPLREFPKNVLPSWLHEFVTALSRSTETPLELTTLMALAVISVTTARIFRVQVKPGYFEQLLIWVCVSLESGNRKTEVVTKVTAPLVQWEKENAERLKPQIEEAISKQASELAIIKGLRNRLPTAEEYQHEALIGDISKKESALTQIPHIPRLFSSDFTPEKMAELLAVNGERFAAISDEGGILDTLGGRYSNGVPNLDLLLKSHSGSPERVDRMQRSIALDGPCITMAITPQPSVLQALSKVPSFRGRGLLARPLYAVPNSPLGFRSGNTEPMESHIVDEYNFMIKRLLRAQPVRNEKGVIESTVLKLGKDAIEHWTSFWQEIEKELPRETGKLGMISDWGSKLPGNAARLAGILHVAQHAAEDSIPFEIQGDTMLDALQIVDALIPHAKRAFCLMSLDQRVDDAKCIFRWMLNHRLSHFTQRECHHALQSRFRSVDRLKPALEELEGRHLIKERTPSRVAFRPSRTFDVNPALFSEEK